MFVDKSCIINTESIFKTIKLIKENNEGIEVEVRYTHEPEMEYKRENFNIFFKHGLEYLKEYYDYNIHIYSKKEVRELRKKKVQTSVYSSIIFNKEDDYVNLILEKNGNKTLKTPFIYLDYFILRINDMLIVKNTIIDLLEEKEKTELVKREFKLSNKAFEYYRYLYNFSKFETVYVDYKQKNGRELKRDGKFERDRKEAFEKYSKEVDASIQQQIIKNKEVRERNRNREYKEPIDKWKNRKFFYNDLEKELNEPNYRNVYNYLKTQTPTNIVDIFRYEQYKKEEHFEKIILLATEEIKKERSIDRNKIAKEWALKQWEKKHGKIQKPSLEKEILYL